MTVAEMQQLRQALETKLAKAASEVVVEFQERTGCCVDGVRIELIDTTCVGDRSHSSAVSGVRISAQL